MHIDYSIGGIPFRINETAVTKESGLPIKPTKPAHAKDDDEIFGKFGDDEVPLGVTWKEFEDQTKSYGSVDKKATGTLYSNKHKSTQNQITIKQKADRKLLLCICEQSRQILQLNVNIFHNFQEFDKNKKVHQLPADHPAIIKALEFMRPIADKYCNDEVKREGLMNLRDECIRMHKQQLDAVKAEKKAQEDELKAAERAKNGAAGAEAEAEEKPTTRPKKKPRTATVGEDDDTQPCSTADTMTTRWATTMITQAKTTRLHQMSML